MMRPSNPEPRRSRRPGLLGRLLAAVSLCLIASGRVLGAQAVPKPSGTSGRPSPVTRRQAAARQAASAAREQGNTADAVRLYTQALALDPTWQEGWWYLGSFQYDGNDYPDSRASFNRLVELNASLGDAWAMLGLSEYETHDFSKAFPDLRRASDLRVTDPALEHAVDYHLALLLNSTGDAEGASVLLRSLYLEGVRSEQIQVALGLSLLHVPLLPQDLDSSRDALVHEAGELAAQLATHQLEKAAATVGDLLAHYPRAQFVHYSYGSMLASQGKDELAKQQFQAETELDPGNVPALLEWAFVAMKTKDYPESERLARRGLALNDKLFLAHYILGNSLLQAGDAQAALPELERARDLSPESPDVRYSLSRTHARLGEAALAREDQAAFLSLQKKNALDRLELLKRYPGAQSITGVRPTTAE